MVKTSAIKPLSDFLRNSKSHIQNLHATQEPEILTVNGEAAVVVQDAGSYEKMAQLAEQAIQDARLQSAMKYFRDGGKGIYSDDVFSRLEEKYKTS
jgi:PHD/YefM family antitoxin component YafN of YafNO toxin-antitoxin module